MQGGYVKSWVCFAKFRFKQAKYIRKTSKNNWFTAPCFRTRQTGHPVVKSEKIHSLVFGLLISCGDKRWSCVQCWARWECESGKVDVSPRESWLHHLGANVTIKGDSFDKTCCIHLPSHRGCCLWSRLRVDTSLVLVWLQWRSEENACRDLTTAAEIMQCQNCNIAP